MIRIILLIGLFTNLLLSDTIKCLNKPIGSFIIINEKIYFVADNNNIKKHIKEMYPLENICTSNVTNMYNLFDTKEELINSIAREPSVFEQILSNIFSKQENKIKVKRYLEFENISNWDVSNVINMSSMFYKSKFNGDLSNWDVSKVVDMAMMFSYSEFNNNSISHWDVSNVENMFLMFDESKFNGNISNWNISKVKYF